MRAVLAGFVVAASLIAAAEARTVTVFELLSSDRVMTTVRGARIERVAAAPLPSFSSADRRDAALSRCEDVRGSPCRPAPLRERSAGEALTIILDDGFSVSELSFAAAGRNAVPRRNGTVVVNGRPYTLAELSALTLTGIIVIDLGSAAAAGLTLTSFELSALAIPPPGAAIFMLAGLVGIGLASGSRKKV
jgi:hypothetical protein